MILTYKFRIKDATAGKHLARHAIACNQVWNFCVATQREAERRHKGGMNVRWPTAFDLINLCAGSSKELGILADSVCEICRRFVNARNASRRCPQFRSSFGSRRALGWIVFKAKRGHRVSGDRVAYCGRNYRFWKSRDLQGTPKVGAFVQDARGRWYVCIQCEVTDTLPTGSGIVGIDLGLKSLATCSDGTEIPALRHFRLYEPALAIAQRSRSRRRARAIHAKIANSRNHHLNEWSARIARENRLIVVGDVSAAKMKKTRMAKSVSDASWSMFRNQLRYKASRHGAVYIEVDERGTSQTCSACGTIPTSSPKGKGALGMRSWECSNCGASHHRDVNAARNILWIGLECQPPGEGIANLSRDDINKGVPQISIGRAALSAPSTEKGRG